jgi:hypothetical protein
MLIFLGREAEGLTYNPRELTASTNSGNLGRQLVAGAHHL